jgi:ketosteroid isomerase-like protein
MTGIPELARRLLTALAGSDLEAVAELTTPDVVVFGTDIGERWDDRASLLDALAEMRSLGLQASWEDDLACGGDWAAGTADYRFSDGSRQPVRVSMIFAQGRLTHGHFSVAQPVG